MGIGTDSSAKDAVKRIMERIKLIEGLIVSNLQKTGEEAVAMARNKHERNYTDRTGNLRASIGYVIVNKGTVVSSGGFDPAAANSGTDGNTGALTGKSLAESIALKHANDIALIVIAGMYYGVYVEEKNYNVLTFTELDARMRAKKLLTDLFENI